MLSRRLTVQMLSWEHLNTPETLRKSYGVFSHRRILNKHNSEYNKSNEYKPFCIPNLLLGRSKFLNVELNVRRKTLIANLQLSEKLNCRPNK